MNVLGIETSCDETSAAVVVDGRRVLSNVIASQIEIHQIYGGVVPEIAARKHVDCISYIVKEALDQAGLSLSDIDAVAVANGPGLAGALLVGLSFAKAVAFAQGIPLVGVHHIYAHVCANYLDENSKENSNEDFNRNSNKNWEPPFVSLVVSGGHTHLLHVLDYHTCKVLGRTRDDAAGEAFDKVGRALGLPYPGGPQIDKLAGLSNVDTIRFPRATVGDSLDFSFSGLKSAVLQYIQKNKHDNLFSVGNCATSFQCAVTDILVSRTLQACKETGMSKVALAGGVAANNGLRGSMRQACNEYGLQLHMPSPIYCTDNAAMVASGGYYRRLAGELDGYDLNAHPNMEM